MEDTPTREAVVPRLKGRFGRDYTYVDSSPSTQRLLPLDAPEGAVAVADDQTEGRGRLGRRWEAPAGTSVLCSVQLRPPVDAARFPELTVVGAEACAEAIRTVTGLEPALKHPNDVLISGRKVAGILGEILRRINRVLGEPPLNFVLHTAPFREAQLESFHWHLEVIPKLTRVAGFEWGSGFFIHPVPPEDAADALRAGSSRS